MLNSFSLTYPNHSSHALHSRRAPAPAILRSNNEEQHEPVDEATAKTKKRKEDAIPAEEPLMKKVKTGRNLKTRATI